MLEHASHMTVSKTEPVTELLTFAYKEGSRTRSEKYSSKRKRGDTTFRVLPFTNPSLTDKFRKKSSGIFGIFRTSNASSDVSTAKTSAELSANSSESSHSSSKKSIRSVADVLVRERKNNSNTPKPVTRSRAIYHNQNSGWNNSIPQPTAQRLLRVMNSFPLRAFPRKSDTNGNILHYYQSQNSTDYANTPRPLKNRNDIEIFHLPSTPGLGSDLNEIPIQWDSFVDTKFTIEMICPWTQFGVMPHCAYCLKNEHVIPTRRWDPKAGILHTNVDGTFRVVTSRLYKCTKCKKQKQKKGDSGSSNNNTSTEDQEFNCRETIHLLSFVCQQQYDWSTNLCSLLWINKFQISCPFFLPRGSTLSDIEQFLASSRENINTNLIAAFLSSIPPKEQKDLNWTDKTLCEKRGNVTIGFFSSP